MQYVHFKAIKIVNFLSTGKKPVTVSFRPGLNIITGKNYDKSDRANGVGKSTIADAIHFALYGSTIRDLKKENIVNNLFPEELCEVELEFSVEENNIKTEYKIIRTLNPTKCFLYVNGEDKTRSGVPQTTEFITDIINTSSEVFQNSVVMTINNTVPFMAQKKVEKRKFIEGILGLEVFSNMLLIARSEFNDTKRLLDIEISKNEETERSLDSNIKQKESFEENRKKRKEVLLTRQTNNQNELIILNDKLSKLESVDQEAKRKIETDILTLTKSKTEYLKKNRDVEQTITEAATLIKVNTDRIKKLKKVDSKCPHCGKDLAEAMNAQLEKDKNDCEAEIAKYNLVIETNRPLHKSNIDFIEKIDNTLSKLNNKLNNFALRKKEVENYTTRISQLTVWQNQLKVDIEQIDTENNTFDSAIKEIEARITEIKTNINNLQ